MNMIGKQVQTKSGKSGVIVELKDNKYKVKYDGSGAFRWLLIASLTILAEQTEIKTAPQTESVPPVKSDLNVQAIVTALSPALQVCGYVENDITAHLDDKFLFMNVRTGSYVLFGGQTDKDRYVVEVFYRPLEEIAQRDYMLPDVHTLSHVLSSLRESLFQETENTPQLLLPAPRPMLLLPAPVKYACFTKNYCPSHYRDKEPECEVIEVAADYDDRDKFFSCMYYSQSVTCFESKEAAEAHRRKVLRIPEEPVEAKPETHDKENKGNKGNRFFIRVNYINLGGQLMIGERKRQAAMDRFIAAEKREHGLRKWLIENRLQQVEVAESVGVCPSMVNRFIKGKSNSQRLAEWFLREGCPRSILEGFNAADNSLASSN